MPIKNYKQFTLDAYYGKEYCGNESQNPTLDQLNHGLFVRITEALEALATGKATGAMARELKAKDEQLERKQSWIDYKNECIQRLERSLAAHKGMVTKLKKGQGK